MRASFWVLGPLIARMGQAKVSLPGGCAIGTRPVDLASPGPQGPRRRDRDRRRLCDRPRPEGPRWRPRDVPDGLRRARRTTFCWPPPWPRARQLIENAAREPEIGDVANCLVKMGCQIEGIGTSTLRVQGKSRLEGAVHAVLPDRIETGTFAFAVAATGGDVVLQGTRRDLLSSALDTLALTGATVTDTEDGLRITRNGAGLAPVNVETAAVPGLPDRPAGAAHGADGARRGHERHPRNDFRKPLHARAGAGASRRRHQAARRHGNRSRREDSARRARHGDRPCARRCRW